MASLIGDLPFMLLMLILMLFARGESDAKLSLKKPHMMNFVEKVESQFSAYITLKFAVSLLTGFCTWFFLHIMGVPMATLFGTLACALNFVPNVGSVSAARAARFCFENAVGELCVRCCVQIVAMVLPVPIILCKACKVPPDEENCLNGFSMLIAAGMPVRCALIAALVTTTDDHFVLPGPLQLAHRERCRAARLRSRRNDMFVNFFADLAIPFR